MFYYVLIGSTILDGISENSFSKKLNFQYGEMNMFCFLVVMCHEFFLWQVGCFHFFSPISSDRQR